MSEAGGRYQIVVSFQIEHMTTPMDHWLHELRDALRRWAEDNSNGISNDPLDVAVRELGASGETMEHEGLWPPGSLHTVDSKGLL